MYGLYPLIIILHLLQEKDKHLLEICGQIINYFYLFYLYIFIIINSNPI